MSHEYVLITGCSGMLGNAVMTELEQQGIKTIGIDIRISSNQTNCVQVDVNDIHALHRLMRQHVITRIVHCGALSGPMVEVNNPYHIFNVNVAGTVNLLEISRIYKIKRFVYCSSTSVYGDTRDLACSAEGISEAVRLCPRSVYGATKAAAERMLDGYRSQHGVDGVSVRLCWVYGSGRTTPEPIKMALESALQGTPLEFEWGIGFPRQYIYIRDAAQALTLACMAPTVARSCYNATSGESPTLDVIMESIQEVVPQLSVKLSHGNDPLDDYQDKFDISAIGTDIGFYPQYSLKKGVQEYLALLSQGALDGRR